MKSKKDKIKKLNKKTNNKSAKKLLEELSGLEVELGENEKKEIPKPEKGEVSDFSENFDLGFNEINSHAELRRLLSFRAPREDFEINPVVELEGTVASAPRVSVAKSPESRELDYSKSAYDADLYKKKAGDYELETPNYSAKAPASGGESGMGTGFEQDAGSRGRRGGNGNSSGEGSGNNT